VLLSLLTKRHASNEYYRDAVIAEHDELLRVITGRDVESCERAIRSHLSATYDRLISSFDGADAPVAAANGVPDL
jgi:DNA-binding GntR family transcriptional regulator